MVAIGIEDLEMCFGNSNVPLGKSSIWFELLAHKREIDK